LGHVQALEGSSTAEPSPTSHGTAKKRFLGAGRDLLHPTECRLGNQGIGIYHPGRDLQSGWEVDGADFK